MSKVDRETNLSEKLNVIRNLPIRIDQKIFMCLVCLDLIPAWEIMFSKDGDLTADSFNSKLIDAGFETRIMELDIGRDETPGKRLEIFYSNSIESVDELFEIRGYRFGEDLAKDKLVTSKFGELYGFPATAVKTYVNDSQATFSKRNLPLPFRDEDYVFLVQFALSKDHWQEELKVVKSWADALMQHVSDLWQEFITEKRRMKAANYGDWPV